VRGKRQPGARPQAGLATVEMAIALPLLLLLMLATAEFGRILSQYNTLTKATRDACRYVASNAAVGTTRVVSITPQLQTNAGNLLVTGNVNGSGSPLLPGLATGSVTVSDAGNGYVRVSVSYTYQPMIGATLPTFGLAGSIPLAIPLSAAVVMRAL
jgi:Flp pilus assembly protein TadG